MFFFSLTGCSALRGSRGIRILGSAPDGRNRGYRDGLGKSPQSPHHLFRHVLRTRLLRDLFRSPGSTSQSLGRRPYKRPRTRPLPRALPFSLLLLPISPPLSLLLLSPDSRSSSARRHGEREDGGVGAREEGDREGEGQADQPGWILVEVWPVCGLDLGRLDPLGNHAGRPRRPGGGGIDPPQVSSAPGGRN